MKAVLEQNILHQQKIELKFKMSQKQDGNKSKNMVPSWFLVLPFEGRGAVHALTHEASPLSLYWAEEKAKKHTAVQSTTWFYIIHIFGTTGHRERQQAELLSWNS